MTLGASRLGALRAPLRVIVVGGGIAGLTAAHRLVEASRQHSLPLALTLLEAGGRLGGNIRTERVDGFLVEAGPDSFVTEKPWALTLVKRIGLGPRLCGADERYRRTYVVHGGRLHVLPEGFLLMAPTRAWPVLRSSLFSWLGKTRMGLDLVLPRGVTSSDESLASFVTRRLGREALDRVAAPLVAGIQAADAGRLSLAATMPRFQALEREHRSLILGLRRELRRGAVSQAPRSNGARRGPFATLAGGMGELVEALAARLPAGSVQLACPVAGLAPGTGDAAWDVQCGDGSSVAADGVILAGEAHRMAGLVRDLDPELARLLRAIPYASLATVTLAYPRVAIRHPLDAYGFVVSPDESRAALAGTFSSVKYPGRAPDGHALLRVYIGGARESDILEHDDAELVRRAHADLASLLGISGPPVLSRVARHRRVLPQYEVGHLDRVSAIEARLAPLPGLALAGAAYRGVGIADSVRFAEDTADRLLAALGRH